MREIQIIEMVNEVGKELCLAGSSGEEVDGCESKVVGMEIAMH